MTERYTLRGKNSKILGEGVSCYLSYTAAKGRAYGGVEDSGAVEAGEWWTVGLSHQGWLLTCTTERRIHHTHTGASALHDCTHIEKTTATCQTYVGKRGTAITARGYCTTPIKKLYYTHPGEERCPTETFAREKNPYHILQRTLFFFF